MAQVPSSFGTPEALSPLICRTESDPRPVVVMTCGIAGMQDIQVYGPGGLCLCNVQHVNMAQGPASHQYPNGYSPTIHLSIDSPSIPISTATMACMGWII